MERTIFNAGNALKREECIQRRPAIRLRLARDKTREKSLRPEALSTSTFENTNFPLGSSGNLLQSNKLGVDSIDPSTVRTSFSRPLSIFHLDLPRGPRRLKGYPNLEPSAVDDHSALPSSVVLLLHRILEDQRTRWTAHRSVSDYFIAVGRSAIPGACSFILFAPKPCYWRVFQACALIYPSPNSRNKTEVSGNSHLSEKWNLIADDESATGLTNRTFPARIFAYEAIDINKQDRMNVIECRYPSPLLQ